MGSIEALRPRRHRLPGRPYTATSNLPGDVRLIAPGQRLQRYYGAVHLVTVRRRTGQLPRVDCGQHRAQPGHDGRQALVTPPAERSVHAAAAACHAEDRAAPHAYITRALRAPVAVPCGVGRNLLVGGWTGVVHRRGATFLLKPVYAEVTVLICEALAATFLPVRPQ